MGSKMREGCGGRSLRLPAPPLTAILLLLTVGLGTSITSGQDQLRYDVAVSLKLVQVYVTDKAGNTVRDLTVDDFALFDDGKPVYITEFERHELGLAQTLPDTGAMEAPASSSAAPVRPAAALGRKFILFFDMSYNNVQGILVGQKAALHFLDNRVGPGDEVALMTMSMMGGLKVREYLTPDKAKVRRAVVELSSRENAGRADQVERAYWQVAEMAKELEGQEADNKNVQRELAVLEAQRKESKLQAEDYIKGLTDLAMSLRLVPGQKTLVFFSTGMPYTLIYGNPSVGSRSSESAMTNTEAGSGAYSQKMSKPSQFDIGNTRVRPLQEKLLKELSAANCTLFAFDTRESAKLASLFAFDAAETENLRSLMFSVSGVHRDQGNLFQDRAMTGEDTLRRMSKETGGQYFSSISLYEKNLKTLDKVTGTYYVLGFPWTAGEDGRFHRIRVQVKRKGCKVVHQAGYYDPKPFAEYSELEKKIHLLDLALNGRLDLGLPVAFPISTLAFDAGRGNRLFALARIPRSVLTSLRGRSAEIVTLVFDGEDNLVDLARSAGDPAAWKDADILLTTAAPPRPGRYEVRVVVRDLETGASAVASTTAIVPNPQTAGLAVGTPLLLADVGAVRLFDAAAHDEPGLPGWRDLYPFDPAQRTPIVGPLVPDADGWTATKITAVLPVRSSMESSVAVAANIVNASTGASAPLAIELKDRLRRNGVEILVCEFSLAGMEPGRHLVYFRVADQTAGQTAYAFTTLELKR
jgi:VWFA-related protein